MPLIQEPQFIAGPGNLVLVFRIEGEGPGE